MKNFISKKQISKIILPSIGSIIENKYKVIYVNESQFRITATGNELPQISTILNLDGKKFKISNLNFEKNRFSADFIGYDEQVSIPDAPNLEREVVNLLDD